MSTVITPDDTAWVTWTLVNVTDNTNRVTPSVIGGTAVSGVQDAGSGYLWYHLKWNIDNRDGFVFEYKTADTSIGLTAATYTEIQNDSTITLDDRKRFIQMRATFSSLDQNLYNVTSTYEVVSINNEMAFGTDGLNPTKDGIYKGRRIICAVCGLAGRKSNMRKQRGKYVHTSTCYDKRLPKKRGG
jgi:hypothetical protein